MPTFTAMQKALLGGFIVLCSATLGCGTRSAAPTPAQLAAAPASRSSSAPPVTLVQKQQERAALSSTLQGMTLQQRADYFKNHPGDGQLFAR